MKISIVGIGPGHIDLIPKKTIERIENADILIGGKRQLDSFAYTKSEKFEIAVPLEKTLAFIAQHTGKNIVIAASGDPLFYGIYDYLNKNVSDAETVIEVIPGITAMQYFASALKMKWDDWDITSVHGKTSDVGLMLSRSEKLAVYTGGVQTPGTLCKQLLNMGFRDIDCYVGENLSYENERITQGSLSAIADMDFCPLTVMLFVNKSEKCFPLTSGLPDNVFDREKIPMTKEEIRAVSVSKLKLTERSVVADIGSGSGSVSCACALAVKKGYVYAIEKKADAMALTKKNMHKLGIRNMKLIEGEAPDALKQVDKNIDRVFIGGSGGNMGDIIAAVHTLCESVVLVANCVTIQSACETLGALRKHAFTEVECVQIQIAKSEPAGNKDMLKALNPIYIIKGEKGVLA